MGQPTIKNTFQPIQQQVMAGEESSDVSGVDGVARKRKSHAAVRTKSVKKSKKKKKTKKNKNLDTSKVEAEQREAEPEQAELPIGHYVDDRKVMLQHVFASVPRCQIQAMLPPVLKELPLGDVQLLCLHQLERMSDQTVVTILNGEEVAAEESTAAADGRPAQSDCGGKTLMELLELEMRARAIKALLKRQEEEEAREQEQEREEPVAPPPPTELEEEQEQEEEEAGIQEVEIELGLASDSSF